MKKFTMAVLAAVFAFGAAGRVSAEGEGSKFNNAISINPLPLVIGMVDGQYELRLNPSSGLPLRVSYWGWELSGWKYSRVAVGAAYRMYPKGNALEGLYWGPQAAIAFNKMTYTDDFDNSASASLTGASVGIEGGNQWIWDSGFLLDLGVSVGYNLQSKAKVTINGTDYEGTGGAGIGYGFRLAIGFAF